MPNGPRLAANIPYSAHIWGSFMKFNMIRTADSNRTLGPTCALTRILPQYGTKHD